MPRFFIEHINGDTHVINGSDALHISRSLRMKPGQKLTICDTEGFYYDCEIAEISDDKVRLNILEKRPCQTEPTVKVTLYQGLPKSDKMDVIIQKSVELGVAKIVPVIMERSVSRPDQKSAKKKLLRWQKIAESAAKQSARGLVPKVNNIISMKEAILDAAKSDTSIFFYEGGGENIGNLLTGFPNNISVFIGPEGGFSLDEVLELKASDIYAATLGSRILRTETAPISALSVIMYVTKNM